MMRMGYQTFSVVKITWAGISIYWGIILIIVLSNLDPATPLLDESLGLDAVAITIFVATIVLLGILEINLVKRYREKHSITIRMLLLVYPAFLAAIVVSLILEIWFFVDLLGRFLNKTVFVFVTTGLIAWFLVNIDVFDAGLYWPRDAARMTAGQHKRNWSGAFLLLALLVVIVSFLTKSIWSTMNLAETILQTAPALVIAVFVMAGLFVKPIKILKAGTDLNEREKIGFISLFTSGIVLLGFLITYVMNLVIIALQPGVNAYLARGIFYYIAMAMIPVFSILNYVGLIYPVKKKP
jgi:hypothetical protein